MISPELIAELLPEIRGQRIDADSLRAFLDLNYRINTTRYFALFDGSERCCALLSVFVGSGARFSISMRASVSQEKNAQERFVRVVGTQLLPALIRSVKPA